MATVTFGNYPVDMDDPASLDPHVPYGGYTAYWDSSSTISVQFWAPRPLVVQLYGSFNLSSPAAAMASTWTGFRMWEGYRGSLGALVIELTGLPPVRIDTLLSGSVEWAIDYARQIDGLSFTITSGNFADNLAGGSIGDVLNGNGGDDRLQGLGGNDQLNGGPGADTMEGGPGDDGYSVDDSGDRIVEASGEGTDSVRSSVTFTLPDHVEQLTLTGTAAIDAIGNGLANRLVGTPGANLLDGLGGADRMEGGAGDDSYCVDSAGDLVTEGANAGHDRIVASIDWTLPVNVEDLELAGAAIAGTGNALDNEVTGNGLANRLAGGAGNDLLDGGAGVDELTGGAGNDSYVVDDPGDRVIELAGGGEDAVTAGMSYALGDHVERLVLTGSGDFDGTGNGLANWLVGNEGANVLDGGAGADTMEGGAGDDTYRVDNPGDVVIEQEGGGTDRVQASVSFRAGGPIERIEFTGTAAVEGHGCVADDCVTGNDGDNRIEGLGGDDDLAGGGGTDCLFGGSGEDSIEGGEGNDYLAGGVGDDTVLGGAGDDIVRGWVGSDWLDGGAGADRLRGGPGDDVLVFDADDRCADGGTGFDTLRLAGTGQDLDLTLLPDGRLLGIERIDLEGAGENTLTLEATDLVALSPTTDELWVDGDATDELVLTGGGWVDAGVAAGYHTYTDAATGAMAHADIDLDVTLV